MDAAIKDEQTGSISVSLASCDQSACSTELQEYAAVVRAVHRLLMQTLTTLWITWGARPRWSDDRGPDPGF